MKSQRRRRPVRPLTIYGFRRGRPKYRGVWLALLVLASLSVLPRVLSPIAERFWGTPHKLVVSTPAVPQSPPAIPEAGSAFAGPEPEPTVAADSIASAAAPDTVAAVSAPPKSPTAVPHETAGGSKARPHRSRTLHRKTAAEVAPAPSDPAPLQPPPPRPRLVPPPR
jgi:hypothetical protein